MKLYALKDPNGEISSLTFFSESDCWDYYERSIAAWRSRAYMLGYSVVEVTVVVTEVAVTEPVTEVVR